VHHYRYYRYNFRRHIYVYDPVTVVYSDPVVVVPEGYDSFSYGGITYYYNDGRFYVPSSGKVVEVQPPVGAVVVKLPDNSVVINDGDETYYVDDGIFYRKVWDGYKVIAPPFGPRDSDGVLMAGNDRDDISIRLPDSEGGYVEVLLSRTGQGFKGPQDEYYPEFPPMDQLQEMYGSKNS
jgi:hypothetical protein